MRLIILFFLLWGVEQPCFCQHNLIDSLQKALKKEKSDTGKAIILYNLSYAYQVYKPDSALLLAQQAYDLSIPHHFLAGESWALGEIAGAFHRMGNNSQALEYYIWQLKIEEERNNSYNVAIVNMSIAFVYNGEKDTAKAIYYILKADSVINNDSLNDLKLYSLLNTGDIFEKANRLRDALAYTMACYNLAIKNKDSLMIGSSLNNLGNIYSKTNDIEKAIVSYKTSLPYLTAANDYQSISEGKLGLAKVLEKKNINDSSLHFATASYKMSSENGFLKNALAASTLISQLYKKQKKIDSAFAYREISDALKDSIESREKIKQLESISIEEQLRQQHLVAVAKQEKEEEREKLQLLAIGILIPVFFLMSLYISRTRVNKKVIEYSGIISLLLLFEYITLLIHPFIAEVTNHSPVIEIIILVCIAAVVVPAHHKIESWFIKRLALIHEKHSYKKKIVTEIKNENDEGAAV